MLSFVRVRRCLFWLDCWASVFEVVRIIVHGYRLGCYFSSFGEDNSFSLFDAVVIVSVSECRYALECPLAARKQCSS